MRLSRQFSLFVCAIVAILIGTPESWAITTLRKVQVANDSRIDLHFDAKINSKQIQTEFFNDIIQVSLSDVSVYPAKITSLKGEELSKVFAYQYSPKLVRCRLTVKGKAEDYQGRFKVVATGKTLSLQLDESVQAKNTDAVKTTAASPAREDKETKPKPAPKTKAQSSEDLPLNLGKDKAGEKAPTITGGKPLPSLGRVFAVMGFLLAILFGLKFLMKKGSKSGGPTFKEGRSFMPGFLSKFSTLKISSKNKMIEVVANHYLGPKKSIAVVKIGARTLVLGVTEESINLITQLNDQGAGEEALNEDWLSEGGWLKESLNGIEKSAGQKPAPQSPAPKMETGKQASAFSEVLNQEQARPSARARIRSRIEGLKPL